MDEREEFEALLAEKRHKEIFKALKDISTSLSEKSNQELISLVEKQTQLIEQFVNEIGNFDKSEPKIEVDVDQDKVVMSITEMGQSIIKGLSELKEGLYKEKDNKRWEFSVQRGLGGVIDKIVAIQK